MTFPNLTPACARRFRRFRAFLERQPQSQCWDAKQGLEGARKLLQSGPAVFLQFLSDGFTLIGLLRATGKRPLQVLHLRSYLAVALLPLDKGQTEAQLRTHLHTLIGQARRFGLALANSQGKVNKSTPLQQTGIDPFSDFPVAAINSWYAEKFSRRQEPRNFRVLWHLASAHERRVWNECRCDPYFARAARLVSFFVRNFLPLAVSLAGRRWALEVSLRKGTGFAAARVYAGSLCVFGVSAQGKKAQGRDLAAEIVFCPHALAHSWGSLKEAQSAIPAQRWEQSRQEFSFCCGHLEMISRMGETISLAQKKTALEQSLLPWAQSHPEQWVRGFFDEESLRTLLFSPTANFCVSAIALAAMRFSLPPENVHNRLLAAEMLAGIPSCSR